MTDASQCPRCGTARSPAQEYCLECGLRLPGPGRLGPVPTDTHAARVRLIVLALVALAGAVVAIAATWEPTETTTIVTATGGSETVATPRVADPATELTTWPHDRTGWTVVLVSVPKDRGRDKAVAVAGQALRAGLRQVGIIDSSRFASLQPGYWTVFVGVTGSKPEATDRLRRARTVVRSARTQEIVPA